MGELKNIEDFIYHLLEIHGSNVGLIVVRELEENQMGTPYDVVINKIHLRLYITKTLKFFVQGNPKVEIYGILKDHFKNEEYVEFMKDFKEKTKEINIKPIKKRSEKK